MTVPLLNEKNYARAIAAVMLLSIPVVGCTPAPSVHPSTEQPLDGARADLDDVLNYFEHLRTLTAAELRREADAARQAYAHSPSERNRVRLALALSQPPSSVQDYRLALDLLQPLAVAPRTPLRGFATVLHANIVQRTISASDIEALQDRLAAARRDIQALQTKLGAAGRNAQELQDKLDLARRNAQDLQDKLDALRQLERSLSERERRPSGGRK
jgi:hypothetical protein